MRKNLDMGQTVRFGIKSVGQWTETLSAACSFVCIFECSYILQ